MRWLLVAMAACSSSKTPATQSDDAIGYLKGQLHLHSSHSGDSQTPPERVASWYEEHGYDFIVFTDHNRITSQPPRARMLVIPGVELTQNLPTCEPPPTTEGGCLVHVNALFVSAHELHAASSSSLARVDLYTGALETARELGGIAQLNHPNFHWAADAALVTELVHRGLVLFEVANQSSDVANEGDADHPSTEAIWDAVLTAGGTLYGTATDDAHQYDDADAVRARGIIPDIGDRGWVMVHAARDPMAIRDALVRGDFYASTGVTLDHITRTATSLDIDAGACDCDFLFIGPGGETLSQSHGRRASQPLGTSYVRAVVTDPAGHRAWVQPIRP